MRQSRRTLDRPVGKAVCLVVVASVALGAFGLLLPRSASAQTSGGQLDLYQGTVVGSPRIVGMGGTAVAVSEDMTGTLASPAALSFRPPGSIESLDSWDWDFYLDQLVAPPGTDLANSGLGAGDGFGVTASTGGACIYVGRWGIGLAAGSVAYALPPGTPGAPPTDLSTESSHITVARSLLDGQLGVGASLIGAAFTITQGETELFDLTALSLGSGALWRPRAKPWRVGLSARLSTFGGKVTNQCPDQSDCNGFVPPTRGQAPWQIGAGMAWRFGLAEWNDPRPILFRDERALVLAADLGLVGRVVDGISVAGFAAHSEQASGRGASLSARVGAEAELMPGRFRLRGGAYWEPARIDARVGRVHGTAGLEVRLFKFNFRSKERRVRLAFASDFARHYQNAVISLGFWH